MVSRFCTIKRINPLKNKVNIETKGRNLRPFLCLFLTYHMGSVILGFGVLIAVAGQRIMQIDQIKQIIEVNQMSVSKPQMKAALVTFIGVAVSIAIIQRVSFMKKNIYR